MFPESLPRLTPTNIGDLECSKKFHVLRVLKQWPSREDRDYRTSVPKKASQGEENAEMEPPAPSPVLSTEFGTGLHEILRNIYDPRHPVRPCLTHLDVWARTAFYLRRYTNDRQRRDDIARAIQMARTYVGHDDQEDADGTIDVEYQAEFPQYLSEKPLFMLWGRLDRIIVRAGAPRRLVVRDYKTSRRRIDLHQAFVLLWVAKLAFPGYDEYALELDWISADAPPVRDVIEASDLKGVFAVVREKAVRVLTSEHHPPEPGEACSFCALRPTCQPTVRMPIPAERQIVEPKTD